MTPPNDQPAHHDAELGFALPPPARLSRRRAVVIGAIAAVLVCGAVLGGWLPRHRAARALARETQAQTSALARVEVVLPKQSASDRSMALPGSVQALQETVLYPRSDGYVRKWTVDIGDKVAEGDLLAEIDTPEIDQQLAQAQAQLAQAEAGRVQAEANRDYSALNRDRLERLVPAGVASQQELDQGRAQAAVDVANVKVAEAAASAQRANIQRLVNLKSFGRVVAPFAGTITTRTIERGALVSAGNATPLFKIAANDPVRFFVQVPQDVAPSVRPDVPAQITVREYPGKVFEGRVTRSAGALDPATRTMNTEVRVPNPKGELLVGMYAQAALTLPSPHRVFELPGTALVNDAKGLRVAVVGEDDKIRFRPVGIERDTGSAILVSSGLEGSERVVSIANAGLTEGLSVEVRR
jgi:RND family efflux transporter MFP subunit